jgi:hypothetical protein
LEEEEAEELLDCFLTSLIPDTQFFPFFVIINIILISLISLFMIYE